MKFKNFLIIFCIVILATLSAVSASEDMSLENLTAIDNNEESIELVENADLTQDVQEATNEDINEDYDGNLKLEEGCDESLSDPESSFENNVYIPESIDLTNSKYLMGISDLPIDLEGNISIKLNDVEIYNKHPNENYLSIYLEDNFNFGDNSVEVSYFGGNYKEFSITKNVKIDYTLYGRLSDFGDQFLSQYVSLPDDAKSGINVSVNNKKFYFPSLNWAISKDSFLIGSNNVTWSYSDSKYPLKNYSLTYFLTPSFSMHERVVGDEEISGYVIIPRSEEGSLSVINRIYNINGSYTEEEVLSNLTCHGSTLFKFKNNKISSSFYYLKFECKNDVYTKEYTVYWSESEDNLEVNFTKNLKYGEEFKLKIHNPSDYSLFFDIYLDSLYTIDYDSKIIRGYSISNNVSISIPNLKVGNHTIVIKSGYIGGYYKICNFTVEPNEAISNNTELINNTSSNEIINNKSVSDKTNTNTVKSLVLKKIKIKRSASKLTLSATLKINKKAISGKVITFKFNGKTFKAKTNSKGIAKVTIKKSYFKKIKIGKKIKYQAKYGKISVTKTAKVTR